MARTSSTHDFALALENMRYVRRRHAISLFFGDPGVTESVALAALALGILASVGKDLDREKQITQRDASGCWQVDARSGRAHLTFILSVQAARD